MRQLHCHMFSLFISGLTSLLVLLFEQSYPGDSTFFIINHHHWFPHWNPPAYHELHPLTCIFMNWIHNKLPSVLDGVASPGYQTLLM